MIVRFNKKAAASAIATGTLLFNAFATTAFATTTIQISGNGSSSDNDANVTTTNTNTVVQNNDAKITNNVSSNASTGGNDANDNTGGDVLVLTGNAATTTDVSTQANVNSANIDSCGCATSSDVLISGNGSHSTNNVDLTQTNSNDVYQDNYAKITNNVDSNASTGRNDANRNTGGSVIVLTGNASSEVAVSNAANANTATIGGNSHGSSSGASIRILGNGSYSDNDVYLTLTNSNLVTQENDAKIRNYVDSNAKTGGNDANDNTGGDVLIDTGWAHSLVEVDNMVNFNAADVDCGCVNDVLAKIADNGTHSYNDIYATLDNDLDVYQGGKGAGNNARLYNDVDSDAKTGHNDANRNTGSVLGGDPAVLTGNSLSETSVSNQANANFFGPWSGWELPSGFDFDFHFNFNGLFGGSH